MSHKIVTKASFNGDVLKDMVKVAESSLELEIKELDFMAIPLTFSKENMQLMDLSDASW